MNTDNELNFEFNVTHLILEVKRAYIGINNKMCWNKTRYMFIR